MEHIEEIDLAIVGGGPAGMAAALVAGRARLRTVVFNEEAPRNAVSLASHGLLTRDGAHAEELLAVAKGQLRKYTRVTYRKERVLDIDREETHFVLRASEGALRARRVILATGFRDLLEDLALPGIEEVYGRSVFPCPFCDGFEHADERWAVFMTEGVSHYAAILRVWSKDLVVFTNGRSLSEEARAELDAHGIPYDESRVVALHSEDGVLKTVETTSRRWDRDAGWLGEEFAEPAAPFADALGVKRIKNPWGRLAFEVGEGGETEVDGLYLVGDAHRQFGGLAAASYDGSACAMHIVHAVAAERWGSVQGGPDSGH